ncbi:MAG TPA: glycoside hydrolase family 3 N-terminal domain-containing protein, partial [Chloroflexota bacterium]
MQSVVTAHAQAMWNLGITMDLAPVLDTAVPSNTIADEADRSFSYDPQIAATYGIAYANGLRAGGVVAVGKHFPGFGQANANTDLSPATDPPLSELQSRDLIPFQQAIGSGLPVIMITHASVPGLTGTAPASLSPATYQYLRNTLHFNGVALTDSLSAVAITDYYTEPAASVKAIESGADMVMIQATAWQGTLTALQDAVNVGGLSVAEINASVTRILNAKSIATC